LLCLGNVFYNFSGEVNSVENYHSIDTCDDFWEYQEQLFNGLQEKNTIEDTNIKEKHLRLVNHHFYDGVKC